MNPTTDGGLISTYGGRVILLLILTALGLVVSMALTVLRMLRHKDPLFTQVNQETGMKEHGIGRWFLVFCSIFVGPAVLAMVIATVAEVNRLVSYYVPVWMIPIIAAVALLGIVVAIAVRSHRKSARASGMQPQSVEEQQAPAPVGWSLPAGVDQWDQPGAER